MKLKLPITSYNWISLIGATIAIISFFMIVFLFVVSVFLEEGRTYLGLVIYIVLPVILIAGLLLIPVGMYIKSKKLKKPEAERDRWPIFDLNNLRHRNAFYIFLIGTSVFLFASAVGSYEAFNFTESNEFCGEMCHSVMKPEYVAYQNSPHARVHCVDCHVGEGADWYVRSKLSGAYQVYAVLADVYPKPIPTPIENLRPARETCEKCHWPEKFYARKLQAQKHYMSDENNTEWDIYMTMKVGATYSAYGLNEGIHWHINPDVEIEYVTTDEKHQVIPWVRYKDKANNISYTYTDSENPIQQSELDSLEVNVMDCMDCHNRPSHTYLPPAFFVDDALTAGKIPKELPEIKYVAMEILANEFTSTDSALIAIETRIKDFYKSNYSEISESQPGLVEQAITGLQEEFQKNIFPEMRVRWSAYPNNIGHVEFDGCFRCHSDNHVTEDNRVISKDCNLCHTINAQGTPGNMEVASINEQLEFKHPVDIDEIWKEVYCTECHTGLNP